MQKSFNFIFFGTPDLAVTVLEELRSKKLIPKLIVTAPDRKQGRGMQLTPPPVKIWAQEHNIPVLQPETLSDSSFVKSLTNITADVFVVVAYGKIIPQSIIDLSPKGIVNVHPSLLPHHRGPSPLEAQILADDPSDVGVSIMLIDAKMDHGPILGMTHAKIPMSKWPLTALELEALLAPLGGRLLAETLPRYVAGEVEPQDQDHAKATYCKLIKKTDAELNLENSDPRKNFLKIKAYSEWPRAYFFTKRNGKRIRVVVTEAQWQDDQLVIKKVIPEGKKEIDYFSFKKSL